MTRIVPLFAVCATALCLNGCATPSTVTLPADKEVEARRIDVADISQLPPPVTRVMSGDTLRIVRDAQTPAEKDEATLYFVRPDGGFAYPFIGTVRAAGRTPEAVGEEVSAKLARIYRYPQVTVNIAIAPGNRVFVGGAVRNPSAFELSAAASIEQAIIGAGGVLPTADSSRVALLRLDDNGRYKVYFTDFSRFLQPDDQRRAVMLQRGDVVFVPKSAVGNGIEVVDLYLNQLLPFSKAIGLGLNYNLNSSDTNVNIKAN
ncbi:polysaccharide biosynthesis/export family protein [uncultured Aquitalea sp.]|uniref:polysaccharide biosynthesis/export family protein n=1 Tax=uncultured Aquitalea sp. TaxID=540272 RepID=UPI0025F4279A|nr:polysaccharide biosynthesis/export family protein [uncultured Aquitalea sp.]